MQRAFSQSVGRRAVAPRAEMRPQGPQAAAAGGRRGRAPVPSTTAAAAAALAPAIVVPPPPPPPSYLTVQDLQMVQQRLAARTAYADSPLIHHQHLLEPAPLPPPKIWEEHHPSMGWMPQSHHLSAAALWQRLQDESRRDAAAEPTLASFLHSSILAHRSFEGALAFVLASKLASPTLFSTVIKGVVEEAYAADPGLLDDARADLHAVVDRDPACASFSQALLLFKGYQAIQAHRVAHHLWGAGRRPLALLLQSRISETFHVDIHPAAVLGRGLLLDHATGIVIGETAVLGDNVSLLHHVTLGGSGVGRGARHPRVGHGVLLGAGVTVLGPVVVGPGAKVGAGSVVVTDLEAHSVAVGVPARIVKRTLLGEPAEDMDQIASFFDYQI